MKTYYSIYVNDDFLRAFDTEHEARKVMLVGEYNDNRRIQKTVN